MQLHMLESASDYPKSSSAKRKKKCIRVKPNCLTQSLLCIVKVKLMVDGHHENLRQIFRLGLKIDFYAFPDILRVILEVDVLALPPRSLFWSLVGPKLRAWRVVAPVLPAWTLLRFWALPWARLFSTGWFILRLLLLLWRRTLWCRIC
jgi:hypothetical protein